MTATTHVPGFVLKIPPGLKTQLEQVALENRRSMQKQVILAVEEHVKRHLRKSAAR